MILNYDSLAAWHRTRVAILAVLLLFVSYSIISGQKTREETPPLKDRLFFGGSMGLQFGTITDIQVSPVVGLWVLPRLAVAGGPNYRYYRDKIFDVKMSIFGGNAYLQYVLVRDINTLIPLGIHTGIFLHVEDELLNLDYDFISYQPSPDRFFVNTVLAGGGISQQIGNRSSLNIMFLWALNDSGKFPYNNPEIRVSFNF